ncbi:MAG: ABC transporter ATP-binding protein [Neomegalonema sp.]|nr:ABC transporter ATP-binding protein [Neomegalonema sp.]
MIKAEGLVYDYARIRALDGASLSVPKGQVTALVGANGAGKTTLMRLLAGLEQMQEGSAVIGGIDAARDPRGVQRQVGFLADFIGLYDALSARQHLLHFGRAAGLSTAAARERSDQVAGQLAIGELMLRGAAEMSRGQRQRLAIACSLMKDPEILILDEPASGLDPEARAALSRLMLSLKASGKTLLVSSHILSELDDYSDRVVVMRAGRVIKTEDLSPDPAAGAQAAVPMRIAITFGEKIDDLEERLQAILADFPGSDLLSAGMMDAQVALIADPQMRSALLRALIEADLPVTDFAASRRRLQDAYFGAPPTESTGGLA